jgi:hypothetical protein
MSKDVLIQSAATFDLYKGVISSLSHKIAEEGRLVYGRD